MQVKLFLQTKYYMGQYHFKLPKMGESTEATVTKWLKQVGDTILDDPIVEIATDKVDTDVTSGLRVLL